MECPLLTGGCMCLYWLALMRLWSNQSTEFLTWEHKINLQPSLRIKSEQLNFLSTTWSKPRLSRSFRMVMVAIPWPIDPFQILLWPLVNLFVWRSLNLLESFFYYIVWNQRVFVVQMKVVFETILLWISLSLANVLRAASKKSSGRKWWMLLCLLTESLVFLAMVSFQLNGAIIEESQKWIRTALNSFSFNHSC